jgi:sugar lactone lactonase YvrE
VTTVSRTRNVAAALALALLVPAATARAESAGFRHEKSIYFDDKEVPLRNPEGVACTDGGALIVADTGNGRLLTYTWKDGSLTGGAAIKLPQLPYPVRLQLDRKGDLLVLDRKLRRIGRVDVKRAFAGYVEVKGVSDPAAVVPVSFRVDDSDNLYLLDVAGSRVLVLDPTGKVTREIGLPKTGEFTDMAVDPQGKIYVVDSANAAVWYVEKGAGAFQQLTKGMKDRVSFPAYLIFQRGRLLLVDQNGMGVVVLGSDGAYQGRELSLGWNDGQLYYPAQICVSSGDEIFLADRQNNRVQIFAMRR